eukprot:NODE_667_length_1996_cov_12.812018_g617_i0.p1 GENE.NODE_667_length_1996_cov_12.812018_g617_i0~~NODE_667_length_1996_cov_12.812018_g617_i0.p1  ORF type:complete len:631 (+),score=160.13 NODE_667_length_1996_cov_12.812018_g617_i0:160-1893(+)
MDQTAIHFADDGNIIRRESEDARRQAEERERKAKELSLAEEAEKNPELAEQGVSTKILKNQFNFCDRASQTFNNQMRERAIMTEPPPIITFSSTATQWEIYDAYMEDLKAQQAAAAKQKAGGGKKEDEKKKEALQASEGSEDILTSPGLFSSLKVMERMVNQNTFNDITDDYKYWEDAADLYKDDGGTLLPLWKFSSDKVRKKTVTSICWNPQHHDLFAVGYGSYDFLKQGTGMIHCFTLKNPSFPEYTFATESGVMSLDFHPQHPSLLACGLYDGTVLVHDVRIKTGKPIYQSTVKSGKHTDPVWQVFWQKEDTSKSLNFFSVSSDGRVCNWILAKNELQYTNVIELKLTETKNSSGGGPRSADQADPDAALAGLSGGTCFDFNSFSESLFVVGTEEGSIRKCSKAYNSQYLETYDGHYMSVYSVQWNKFHPNVFLSASADWTVKLWEQNTKQPLMSFDLGSSVGEVVWSPYSSTVFAAVTADGKVHVYDLNENKHEPMCDQLVVRKAKLTRICFNPHDPVLLVGDDRGTVLSLKLSPNLRKIAKVEEGKTRQQMEIEKLNKIIDVTTKDRQLMEK